MRQLEPKKITDFYQYLTAPFLCQNMEKNEKNTVFSKKNCTLKIIFENWNLHQYIS